MATCGHCGYESADLAVCPLCGTNAGAVDAATSQLPEAPPPAWEDTSVAFPWSLLETWRRSVLEPSTFFAGVPFERPAARPILYYLIITVLGSFFWLWWSAVFSIAQIPILAGWIELAQPMGMDVTGGSSAAATGLLNFFLAPFGAIFSLVVWSLLLHLFVLMLGRERRGITATVRTISYASGPSLLAVVPIVGSIVGGIWSLTLTVIGLRAAHRMSTGMATTAVLLAIFLPVSLFAVVFFVLLAAVAGSLGV